MSWSCEDIRLSLCVPRLILYNYELPRSLRQTSHTKKRPVEMLRRPERILGYTACLIVGCQHVAQLTIGFLDAIEMHTYYTHSCYWQLCRTEHRVQTSP
jgi:hypothetical protein